MRRRAEFEGVQHVAEFERRRFGRMAEQLKHELLDVPLVDLDAAATQLDAVEHDVVGLGAHAAWIALHTSEILSLGRGKRMMHGIPATLVLVPLHQREVHHPQELELARGDQVQVTPQAQPQLAQRGRDDLGRIGDDEDHVARLRFAPLAD